MSDHHNPSHVPGTEPNEDAPDHSHGRAKRRRFSIASFAKRPRPSEHRSEGEHVSARKGFPLPFSSETRVGIATVLSFLVLMAALITFYKGRPGKPEKPTPKLELASKDRGAGSAAAGAGVDDESESPVGSGAETAPAGGQNANGDPFAGVTSPPPLPKGTREASESQSSDPDGSSSAPPRPRSNAVAEMLPERPTGVLVPPRPSGGGAIDDTPAAERDGGGVVSPPAIPPPAPRSNTSRDVQSDLNTRSRSRDRDVASASSPLDGVPREPEPFVHPNKPNTLPARPDARPRASTPSSAPEPKQTRASTGGMETPPRQVGDSSLDLAGRASQTTASNAPGDWAPVPNLGKVRRSEDGPLTGSPSLIAATKSAPRPASAGASNSPGSQSHVVRENETFFTISQLYYGSGRYYRALWAVNRRLATSLKDPLIVGMSVKVPAFEELDATLFDRPATKGAAAPAEVIRSTPAPRRDGESSLAAGANSSSLVLPVGRPSSGIDPISADDIEALPPRKASTKYPTYVVKKGDTYRSIARELLGTNERADEIRQLNLDSISDSPRPPAGQQLRMPMDARLPQETRLR